ncbi:protein toll [Diachasma alloeum]|uniref:protein toll n=1 Tax=Diachasma alloeum TaxID=454923 RepID=UPI0007383698|nr:protein toll [Diachasma alloeum]
MYKLLWLLVFIVISCTFAAQCPQGSGCGDCQHLPDDEYEIRCSTSASDSMFIVNYRPHSWLKIDCYNLPNWSEFNLGREQQIQDVQAISFRTCQLPEKGKLGSIARQIIANNITELNLQLNDNLSLTLSRETLAEFKSLKSLILSRNKLKNVTADLLHDLENLTLLNLRENDLHELPSEFLNMPHLESIELGSNKLEIIEPTMFEKLTKLKLLNLWNNKIIDIKPHSFDKLKSLKSIDMHTNNLQTLPEDIFAPLENLMVINLSQNNFSANSLPEKLLRNNSLLRTILFFENKQNLTTLPSKFLAELPQLTSVNIRRNKLVYLPHDLFTGSINLRNISMEWNYIEKLPRYIFNDCKDLFSINLAYNELSDLPNGVFSALHKLEKLDISRNHITVIKANLFDGLSSLKVLNIERNGLKIIDPHGLRPLQNLRIAKFSSNQLTLKANTSRWFAGDRSTSPFYPCTRIEELHLANNNISDIFFDWATASHLRTLDLQYNSLKFIHAQDIFFLSENLYVDLSFNNIEMISLTYAEAFATPREYSKNVIVSVENNPINCDCDLYDLLRYREGDMHPNVENNVHLKMKNLKCQKPSWLMNIPVEDLRSKSLKCLVENATIYNATCPPRCDCWLQPNERAYLIDCSYRNIMKTPEFVKAPRGLAIELNFTGNALKKMPSMKKPGYNAVRVLSLSKNQITQVPLDALSQNLTLLALDSNNLTRLETNVINFLNNSTQLRNLTLERNPWVCNCDAREFLSFIQMKKVEIPELQQVKCQLFNKPIFEMTPEEMCPLAIVGIIGVCIVIALLGMIIGIIAALYYRFQQEIKVWLYAKQWCLWLVTEDELDKDKLYDAFISYSHKDEEFVVKSLIEKLEEGPKPFKLCVHFRDWLAGEWIPNQIARSVEDSRRTIVVLSPNFLESIWGKMEFRTAHNQALSEGRARVIIILYGDIGPVEQLDPELKAYLTMNTYVKWGDPWFWEKLKYALPHPQDFVKRKRRQTLFKNQHPIILIANDKSGLIENSNSNNAAISTAQSTPPADTLKTFINTNNETNESLTKQDQQIKVNDNANIRRNCDSVKMNENIDKIQCTTV